MKKYEMLYRISNKEGVVVEKIISRKLPFLKLSSLITRDVLENKKIDFNSEYTLEVVNLKNVTKIKMKFDNFGELNATILF